MLIFVFLFLLIESSYLCINFVEKQSRRIRICEKVPPSSNKRSWGKFASLLWLVSCICDCAHYLLMDTKDLIGPCAGSHKGLMNIFILLLRHLLGNFSRQWTRVWQFWWEEQLDEEGKIRSA